MSGHASEIRPHMEVVGSDGQHVGTVDAVEGDRIKLTKRDDPDGSGQHHHYLAIGTVAADGGSYITMATAASPKRNEAIAVGVTSDRHVSGSITSAPVDPQN